MNSGAYDLFLSIDHHSPKFGLTYDLTAILPTYYLDIEAMANMGVSSSFWYAQQATRSARQLR